MSELTYSYLIIITDFLRNLASLSPLLTTIRTAVLMVVSNGQQHHLTLPTLISLLVKQRVAIATW